MGPGERNASGSIAVISIDFVRGIVWSVMTEHHTSGDATDTERSRPETEDSYGIPSKTEGMLSWDYVADRMSDDRNYWITTTRPDGRPHARPVWGVWIDSTFYCGGGNQTRWARNLATNPEIVVHRESGDNVVIIEGVGEKLTEENTEPSLIEQIDAAYETKYDTRHGTPFWRVQPRVVFGWSDFPDDATRWTR